MTHFRLRASNFAPIFLQLKVATMQQEAGSLIHVVFVTLASPFQKLDLLTSLPYFLDGGCFTLPQAESSQQDFFEEIRTYEHYEPFNDGRLEAL